MGLELVCMGTMLRLLRPGGSHHRGGASIGAPAVETGKWKFELEERHNGCGDALNARGSGRS